MASIKDALEESFQDNHSVIKFILFAIPLFVVINFPKEQVPGYSFWVFLTFLLLFGFTLYCTYNVRTGKNEVLPSFNILAIFWTGLKGLIALAPISIGVYFLATFVNGQIAAYIPEGIVATVISYIFDAICSSLIFTSYLLYANKFQVLDAYNLKAVSNYCVDVLIALLFMGIMLTLVDIIIIAPITYVLWLFFGLAHPVTIFFWCFCYVFNLAIVGHYLAQISYEIIEVKEKANN